MAKIDPTDLMLLLLGDMVDSKLIYLKPGTSIIRTMGNLISLVDGSEIKANSLDYPLSKSEIDGLQKRGLTKQLNSEKVEAKLEQLNPHKPDDKSKHLTWYDYPYGPTEQGVELIEAQRDRLDALRNAIQVKQDAPIFVASKACENRRGVETAVPGVGHLYTITGETAQRWRVQPWNANGGFDAMTVGYGKTQMLPKDNVAAIDISPAQFAAMQKATMDWNERVNAARIMAKTEEDKLLAPIRNRLAQRENQLMAMFEDNMREALENKPDEDKLVDDMKP